MKFLIAMNCLKALDQVKLKRRIVWSPDLKRSKPKVVAAAVSLVDERLTN